MGTHLVSKTKDARNDRSGRPRDDTVMAAVQAACRNPHPVQTAPRFSRAAIGAVFPEHLALFRTRLPQAVAPSVRLRGFLKGKAGVALDFESALWLSCNKNAVTSARAKGSIIAASPPEKFAPKFDAAGLLTAVAVDAATGRLLMLAHMDAEALAKTQETGFAHFHSRSRGKLWMKGETSGHTLRVLEIRVDCDQDAIELRVEPAGPACHTGAPSCFFRRLEGDVLVPADTQS